MSEGKESRVFLKWGKYLKAFMQIKELKTVKKRKGMVNIVRMT